MNKNETIQIKEENKCSDKIIIYANNMQFIQDDFKNKKNLINYEINKQIQTKNTNDLKNDKEKVNFFILISYIKF